MKKVYIASLLGIFLVTASVINARGLLGESYFEFSGSYERAGPPGDSIDGWGFGIGGNVPTRTYDTATWGLDVAAGLEYTRLSGDTFGLDFRLESFHLGGGFVLYPKQWEIGVTPYAGAGVGWRRDRLVFRGFPGRFLGTFSDDTFLGTATVGAEVAAGRAVLRPFFERTWFEDEEFRNTWVFGLTAAYWVNDKWGLSVTGAYEEPHSRFGSDSNSLHLAGGLLYSF